MSGNSEHAENIPASVVLAEVKGQLSLIITMIQNNQQANNQRIDDLRTGITSQLTSHEDRIKTLEGNERETALKAAGTGAVAGLVAAAIVTAGLKAITGH